MESRIGVKLAGITLGLGLAAGLSACSSVPDWVDPTTWIGGSDSKSASDDSGLSKEGQQAEQSSPAADSGQTPDLADVPAKPAPADESQNASVESSLASDRSRANYSADALRGGTEAAAPPPPASAPTDQQVAEVSTTPSAGPAPADDEDAAQPASDAAAPAQPAAAAPAPASDQAAVSSVPGTLPDENAPPPAAPAAAPAPAPQQPAAAAPPPETQVASNEPAPAAAAPAESVAEPAPAPAPVAQAPVAAAPSSPRVDSLGFAQSSAPPLDASVGQFVPAGVVNRYHQTQLASVAPVYGYSTLSAGSVGTRAAVVTFEGDKTVLDDKARGLVKAAADAFRMHGQSGFIRVVGHASSRSENVSAERHMELDFDHSQARATAVAQALIRAGVPADKVLVEAVGDTGPVRAMGADADRSAEIFIQG